MSEKDINRWQDAITMREHDPNHPYVRRLVGCGHGVLFTEPCVDCEIVGLRDQYRTALISAARVRDRMRVLGRPMLGEAPPEVVRLRGRFGVAISLLRECIGPLEVSAAVIESDDGDQMEALIERVQKFVAAAQGSKRCPHCDDTGDVTRADGEWLGCCSCAAGLSCEQTSETKEDGNV